MLPWNFTREGARRGQEDVAGNVWWMYIPFRDGETIDLIICDMKCHPKVMFCGPLTSVRAGCFGEEWSCWMPLIPPALSVNAAGAPGDQPRGKRCPMASGTEISRRHWWAAVLQRRLLCWEMCLVVFCSAGPHSVVFGECEDGGKLSLCHLNGYERLMWWDRRLSCSIRKQCCLNIYIWRERGRKLDKIVLGDLLSADVFSWWDIDISLHLTAPLKSVQSYPFGCGTVAPGKP